jgi:uncharacterized protein YciI
LVLFTVTIAVLCISADGQTTNKTLPIKFDPELAQRLGADEYGMKTYVLAVLKTGKTRIEDKDEINKLQAGHLKNIVRLSEEGKLVLAGPFLKDGDSRGVYVFDVRTIDEAKKLTETDPAIKSGIFEFELYLWYGSAALPELSNIHMKIQKNSIVE